MAHASQATVAIWCETAHELMGAETPGGYRSALPWLRRAARAGEPWAAYHIGLMFDHGLGVGRNVAKAIAWYSAAAAGGYDSAQLNLGIIYANLPGAWRDLVCATALYRSAARQGNRNAMYNLGLYYELGRGVRRSRRLAVHWYSKAAARDDRQARSRMKALASRCGRTTGCTGARAAGLIDSPGGLARAR